MFVYSHARLAQYIRSAFKALDFVFKNVPLYILQI